MGPAVERSLILAAGLAAAMDGGRRAMAAVAGSVAAAINNWRAAMAVLWAWLKTLI